jgi:TPP-dependent pyruvate/acetoin dehydrogenase alpha subunit
MTPGKTREQIQEALDILQEECAEAIVEVSKIRRFGLDSADYNSGMTQTHRVSFVKEVGDVLAMVDILLEQGVLTQAELDVAKQNKKDKLRKWSKIYE